MNGLLFTWGQNNLRQLGDGSNADKYIPTQIGDSTDWGIIESGIHFAFAIKTDGSMWGWGYNGTNSGSKFGNRT